MRLSTILSVVSALTLLASSSALPAVADANMGAKVSTLASPGLNVLDVSPNTEGQKRSLRGLKTVGEDDEERLAGANMFSAEKLEKAMKDAKYAKTLMRRWKRNGYDIEAAKIKLNASKFANDKRLNAIYHRYATWLDKHFSRLDDVKPTGGNNLFAQDKIDKALADSNYAKSLFRKWKTHDHESDAVYYKLKAMGLRNDNSLGKLYNNYMSWLNVHYPDAFTKNLAKKKLLFEESMLLRARKENDYAESLFRAWYTRGFQPDEVSKKLHNTLGGRDGTLFKKYDAWLKTHFSAKA